MSLSPKALARSAPGRSVDLTARRIQADEAVASAQRALRAALLDGKDTIAAREQLDRAAAEAVAVAEAINADTARMGRELAERQAARVADLGSVADERLRARLTALAIPPAPVFLSLKGKN